MILQYHQKNVHVQEDTRQIEPQSYRNQNLSYWAKAGEIIAQYAKKGSGILVSGRLDQHSWEDKTTGQKRSRVEVVVEDFNFLGGNAGAGSASSSSSERTEDVIPDDVPQGDIDLSDIPF